ncbi:MAG: calcium-translocating P-type ATPase, PMCA-type [Bacilli bacterium]|nr:calcium-translocating P-type ATPase, PMCA-type [Bacilli bacterium]
MDKITNGLNDDEVIRNREKYGSNNIKVKNNNTFFSLLLESLGDPIIKILLIALMIKTIFLFKNFDWFETIGILVAIFVASFISTISEYGSEKAFNKLQEEASLIKCRVKREDKITEIPIDDVVVGDLVLLQAGDKIPADGYLLSGNITVDESSLNGETKEQYKEEINRLSGNITAVNRVFRGTVVYSKEATMVVEKVGVNTIYGGLAKELTEKQPDSPLKIKLRSLASVISKIGYVSSFLVSISYLFSVIVINNNFDIQLIKNTITNFPLMFNYILYALTLSVTIIVVAVPEGLPMMITLVLSSNMKRMLKNNVLVRKLLGIETAGSLNILFTDKTGTLTKGKLEVVEILSGNLKEFGSEFELNKYPKYLDIVKKSILYNTASYYDHNTNKIIGGNITDKSLLSFFTGFPNDKLIKINSIPFDSKNKYSITTIDDGKRINLIKGAPEVLLSRCKYYYDENGTKKDIIANIDAIKEKVLNSQKKGIRVIVLATSNEYVIDKFDRLSLVGIVFIKDEVRKEAVDGVRLVQNAHIQTVMITGDNKETATAVAEEVGIINSKSDIVLTGQELNSKTDEELKKILPSLRVVARSLPSDKSRLVRIAQSCGLVVGMTGDGVNDAPALKKADVGFAMGSGTEVSKEASDIVILDDNFMSISKSILFGRTIFKSIRKFVIVQLTINMCAISLSIICPFIGVDTPVTVIQMLWVNMVMDTLAGLAFAFEPPLLEYMNEKPKKKSESIINCYMISEILFTGFYSAALCIFFLKSPFVLSFFKHNTEYLMTAFFGLFIFIDIFNSFNARTQRINLLANISQNRVFLIIMIFIVIVQVLLIYKGGAIFRTIGLPIDEFIFMLLLASTVIPVDWLRKLFLKKNGKVMGV